MLPGLICSFCIPTWPVPSNSSKSPLKGPSCWQRAQGQAAHSPHEHLDYILTPRVNSLVIPFCKSHPCYPNNKCFIPSNALLGENWKALASPFSSQMSGCHVLEAAGTLSQLHLSWAIISLLSVLITPPWLLGLQLPPIQPPEGCLPG